MSSAGAGFLLEAAPRSLPCRGSEQHFLLLTVHQNQNTPPSEMRGRDEKSFRKGRPEEVTRHRALNRGAIPHVEGGLKLTGPIYCAYGRQLGRVYGKKRGIRLTSSPQHFAPALLHPHIVYITQHHPSSAGRGRTAKGGSPVPLRRAALEMLASSWKRKGKIFEDGSTRRKE